MYPYSAEGIAKCLKETCNTESPVVPESFILLKAHGKVGGKGEAIYKFCTEDGQEYEITFDSTDISCIELKAQVTLVHGGIEKINPINKEDKK